MKKFGRNSRRVKLRRLYWLREGPAFRAKILDIVRQCFVKPVCDLLRQDAA